MAFTRSSVFSARAACAFSYSGSVATSIIGSVPMNWNGGVTVSTVTFASSALASVRPAASAFAESSDPSVGIST